MHRNLNWTDSLNKAWLLLMLLNKYTNQGWVGMIAQSSDSVWTSKELRVCSNWMWWVKRIGYDNIFPLCCICWLHAKTNWFTSKWLLMTSKRLVSLMKNHLHQSSYCWSPTLYCQCAFMNDKQLIVSLQPTGEWHVKINLWPTPNWKPSYMALAYTHCYAVMNTVKWSL